MSLFGLQRSWLKLMRFGSTRHHSTILRCILDVAFMCKGGAFHGLQRSASDNESRGCSVESCSPLPAFWHVMVTNKFYVFLCIWIILHKQCSDKTYNCWLLWKSWLSNVSLAIYQYRHLDAACWMLAFADWYKVVGRCYVLQSGTGRIGSLSSKGGQGRLYEYLVHPQPSANLQ